MTATEAAEAKIRQIARVYEDNNMGPKNHEPSIASFAKMTRNIAARRGFDISQHDAETVIRQFVHER